MATPISQIGIVSPVPMNGWNNSINYEKLNIVTHKNGTFIAKQANKGIEPFVTDGWGNVWMPLLSGEGISSTIVEYASGSTSSPTPPQEGWDSEIPAFQAGQLLWTRVTITYTDGKQTVGYSVGVTVAPTKTSELQNDGDGTSPFATQKNALPIPAEIRILDSEVKPAAVWGGTWEELPEGTFIMAAGSGGQAGQTGGSATHTLTVEELATHTHIQMSSMFDYLYTPAYRSTGTGSGVGILPDGTRLENNLGAQITTVQEGGSKPFSILPPYTTSHIWRRIA